MMRASVIAFALIASGCVTMPRELPQAQLALAKSLPLCIFNCRLVIENMTAHGGCAPITQSGGAISETDSHNRAKP